MSRTFINALDLMHDDGRLVVEVSPLRRSHKPRIEVVEVTSTDTTLADLADLRDWATVVTLRPHGEGIYMDDSEITDTVNSDPLGLSAVEIVGGKDELGGLHFRTATGTVKMTVIQEG